MSKKAERRKILELEAEVKRLGRIIENIQDDRDPGRDERLVDMKYVGIIFDKEAYKKGENELNDLLASGECLPVDVGGFVVQFLILQLGYCYSHGKFFVPFHSHYLGVLG